jgi:hypothetical protein
MNCASLSRLSCLVILLFGSALFIAPVAALEEGAGEAKAIDACDKRLCTILQGKDPKGEDLKCNLTKTWAKSTLKEADQRQVKWTFGDARCSVQINLGRATIVQAISAAEGKLWVPPHTAKCIVEQDGEVKTITATVAPKIVFKDGKAEKVWINLLKLEGPGGITTTLSTAAQLNDTIGLFHRSMLKSINGYINKHCPKYHPLSHTAAAAPKAPKAATQPAPPPAKKAPE